jgi:hypothetical protein
MELGMAFVSNKGYIAECSKLLMHVMNKKYFQLKHCRGIVAGQGSEGWAHLKFSATGQKNK